MNLPNADTAIIPAEKLRDYLLSPNHPIGRYKSVFFASKGYGQNNWEVLAADIKLLLSQPATLLESTEHGEKYRVDGKVIGPNKRSFSLTTIWIILKAEKAPRLVTAYPGN